MTSTLNAIEAILRDALSNLTADELVALTMEPYQELREYISEQQAA